MKIFTAIDVTEIDRIKKSMQKKSFLKRLLGPKEYKYYEAKGFPPQSIAAAFCAKEAFFKLLGTGLFCGIDMREVQILHDKQGKPFYSLSGRAKKAVRKKRLNLDLSLSHTDSLAFASACAVRRFF